jgi:AcrR family transcriptional regulator
MPPTATGTRRKLVEAAARAFATQGIFGASLIDITRQAGQRNRGAIHYHFGSREGLLCAVLEPHVGFLHERESELLAVAQSRPDDDVVSVVEAIVRPAVELGETGWQGRCFLVILAELVEEDPANLSQEVQDVLARTGGYEVYALLGERMAPVSEAVQTERFSLVTSFILRSVADRARAHERRRGGGRQQLDLEAFTTNLVAMVAAMLSAPEAALT